ncbi:hypothetical protein ACFQ3Z_04325 [Streptomyces nogalater]
MCANSPPTAPCTTSPCAPRSSEDSGSPALRQALQQLVDRHPAIRTTVSLRGEDRTPVQTVHETFPVDFADAGAAPGDAELDAAVLAEAHRPFDLTRQSPAGAEVLGGRTPGAAVRLPPHRVGLRIGPDRLRGTGRAVPGGRGGHRGRAAPPGAPFAEHGRWEAGFLGSPAGLRGLEFWEAELAQLPSPATCPRFGPGRPHVPTVAASST